MCHSMAADSPSSSSAAGRRSSESLRTTSIVSSIRFTFSSARSRNSASSAGRSVTNISWLSLAPVSNCPTSSCSSRAMRRRSSSWACTTRAASFSARTRAASICPYNCALSIAAAAPGAMARAKASSSAVKKRGVSKERRCSTPTGWPLAISGTSTTLRMFSLCASARLSSGMWGAFHRSGS